MTFLRYLNLGLLKRPQLPLNRCAYCGDPTRNAYACRQHQDLLDADPLAGTGLSTHKR